MRFFRSSFPVMVLAIIALVGCSNPSSSDSPPADTPPGDTPPVATVPTVISTVPANAATAVIANTEISAKFSVAMAPATLTAASFTLFRGAVAVAGSVLYTGTTASFVPTVNLLPSTSYTATITVAAKNVAGTALAAAKVWTFTTAAAVVVGPVPVPLASAGGYVVLAESTITNTGASVLTGDVGLSPLAALTGFTLVDAGTYFTSPLVTGGGRVYTPANAEPTPSNLTIATAAKRTAYTNAATRPAPYDFLEFHTGDISGLTLAPGLYKWSSPLVVNTNITLNGGPNDTWIFIVAQTMDVASGVQFNLTGGAKAKNIVWVVAGAVTFGTTSHVEGVILGATNIALQTGASINGRLLAQTAVTLDASTVVQPAP